MNVWTEAQDALLEELCAAEEKLAAPKIALKISQTFGIDPPLTRASVVGRARRRGLTLPLPRKWGGKWPPTSSDRIEVELPPSKVVNVERTFFASDDRTPYRHDFLPEPVFAPGIFLLNAGDRDCRWPINDPPKGEMLSLRVCGAETYEGRPYCPACTAADAKRARPSDSPTGNEFILPSKQRGLK